MRSSNAVDLIPYEMTRSILIIRDSVALNLKGESDLKTNVLNELRELANNCMNISKGDLTTEEKLIILRDAIKTSRENIEKLLTERPVPAAVRNLLNENIQLLSEIESTAKIEKNETLSNQHDNDAADFSESSTFNDEVDPDEISYSNTEEPSPPASAATEEPAPPASAAIKQPTHTKSDPVHSGAQPSHPTRSTSDSQNRQPDSSTNIFRNLFRRKEAAPPRHAAIHADRELDIPLTFKKNISDADIRKLIAERLALAFNEDNLRTNKNDGVITITSKGDAGDRPATRYLSLAEAEKGCTSQALSQTYQNLNAEIQRDGTIGTFKIGDASVKPRIYADGLQKNYGLSEAHANALELRQLMIISSALFDATMPVTNRLMDIDPKNAANNERVMAITRQLLANVDFSKFGMKEPGEFTPSREFTESLSAALRAAPTAAPAARTKSSFFNRAGAEDKVVKLKAEKANLERNIKTYTHTLSGAEKKNLTAEDLKEVKKLRGKLEKVEGQLEKLEPKIVQVANSNLKPN